MPYQLKLGGGHVAYLDHDYYYELADFRWRWRRVRNTQEVQAARYVTVDGKRRLTYLQNEIMQPPQGHVVIFLNFDRLDCCRSNLCVVPKEEARRHRPRRSFPRSGVKGINYRRREQCWTVDLLRDGKRQHVGKFSCLAAAFAAYDRAEAEYDGQQRAA